MSYCRFSDGSDVYMFHHVAGYVECCGCRLRKHIVPPWTVRVWNHMGRWLLSVVALGREVGTVLSLGFWMPHVPFSWFMHFNNTYESEPEPRLDTFAAALEHLQKHRDAGHDVPEYAFERLREEIQTGRTPTDPIPPCKHGVAHELRCIWCEKEWEWGREEDANPFSRN